MVRQVAVAAGVMVLLVSAACNREEARRKEREGQRAVRLEQKLAKLAAGFAKQQPLDLPAPKSKNLDRLVPEWKNHFERLAACERDLSETMEKVAARRIPEIAGPALAGWQRSSDLWAEAAAKMLRIVEADSGPATSSSVLDESLKLGYFNAVMKTAAVYAGMFRQTIEILAREGPRAERAAVYDQFAALHPSAKTPDLAQTIAGVLRGAWAGEDDPVLKARMEQKLKELHLPLTTTQAPAAKGK
jgi:hypothetical protein